MSDTIPEPVEPVPTPSPESEPAPAETPELTEEQKASDTAAKEERRMAQLRARLGAAEREQARQAAELEFWRRQAQQAPQGEETSEQRAHRERAAMRTEVEEQIRTETFHAAGNQAYPDWRQRCDDLVKFGADAHFAQLLVEMPDGVRVAAALHDDPAEVERIARIGSERGRAVALGKFAARLEAEGGNGHAGGNGAAPAVRTAPAGPVAVPVRPVAGRASPRPDPYRMNADQLADMWMRESLERQSRR